MASLIAVDILILLRIWDIINPSLDMAWMIHWATSPRDIDRASLAFVHDSLGSLPRDIDRERTLDILAFPGVDILEPSQAGGYYDPSQDVESLDSFCAFEIHWALRYGASSRAVDILSPSQACGYSQAFSGVDILEPSQAGAPIPLGTCSSHAFVAQLEHGWV